MQGTNRFDPWIRKITSRRKWQPAPVFLPGKFHGQRSVAGYSLWSQKELDMTEKLSMNALLRLNQLLKIYFILSFPGGPVVKTLRFQCRGHRFDPWLGN